MNVGVESMNYYVQYKRSAEQFYRTYGSLNSAREVMDVLRTERQRDPNLTLHLGELPKSSWANRERQPSGRCSLVRS